MLAESTRSVERHMPSNKALQAEKDKLSCLLPSQKPRQLPFAAELGGRAA